MIPMFRTSGSVVFFECFKTTKTKLCLLHIPHCHTFVPHGRGQSGDKNSKRDKNIYLFETEDTLEPRSGPWVLSGRGGRCEGDFLFSSNCIFLSLIEKLSLGNNLGPSSKFSKKNHQIIIWINYLHESLEIWSMFESFIISFNDATEPFNKLHIGN